VATAAALRTREVDTVRLLAVWAESLHQ